MVLIKSGSTGFSEGYGKTSSPTPTPTSSSSSTKTTTKTTSSASGSSSSSSSTGDERTPEEKRADNLITMIARGEKDPDTLTESSRKVIAERVGASSPDSSKTPKTSSGDKIVTPYGEYEVGNTPFEQLQAGRGEFFEKAKAGAEGVRVTEKYNPTGLEAALSGRPEDYAVQYEIARQKAVSERMYQQNVGLFQQSALADMINAGLFVDTPIYDSEGNLTGTYVGLSERGKNFGLGDQTAIERMYELENNAIWGRAFDFYIDPNTGGVYMYPEGTRATMSAAGFDFKTTSPLIMEKEGVKYLVAQKEGVNTLEVKPIVPGRNELGESTAIDVTDFLDMGEYETTPDTKVRYTISDTGQLDISAEGLAKHEYNPQTEPEKIMWANEDPLQLTGARGVFVPGVDTGYIAPMTDAEVATYYKSLALAGTEDIVTVTGVSGFPATVELTNGYVNLSNQVKLSPEMIAAEKANLMRGSEDIAFIPGEYGLPTTINELGIPGNAPILKEPQVTTGRPDYMVETPFTGFYETNYAKLFAEPLRAGEDVLGLYIKESPIGEIRPVSTTAEFLAGGVESIGKGSVAFGTFLGISAKGAEKAFKGETFTEPEQKLYGSMLLESQGYLITFPITATMLVGMAGEANLAKASTKTVTLDLKGNPIDPVTGKATDMKGAIIGENTPYYNRPLSATIESPTTVRLDYAGGKPSLYLNYPGEISKHLLDENYLDRLTSFEAYKLQGAIQPVLNTAGAINTAAGVPIRIIGTGAFTGGFSAGLQTGLEVSGNWMAGESPLDFTKEQEERIKTAGVGGFFLGASIQTWHEAKPFMDTVITGAKQKIAEIPQTPYKAMKAGTEAGLSFYEDQAALYFYAGSEKSVLMQINPESPYALHAYLTAEGLNPYAGVKPIIKQIQAEIAPTEYGFSMMRQPTRASFVQNPEYTAALERIRAPYVVEETLPPNFYLTPFTPSAEYVKAQERVRAPYTEKETLAPDFYTKPLSAQTPEQLKFRDMLQLNERKSFAANFIGGDMPGDTYSGIIRRNRARDFATQNAEPAASNIEYQKELKEQRLAEAIREGIGTTRAEKYALLRGSGVWSIVGSNEFTGEATALGEGLGLGEKLAVGERLAIGEKLAVGQRLAVGERLRISQKQKVGVREMPPVVVPPQERNKYAGKSPKKFMPKKRGYNITGERSIFADLLSVAKSQYRYGHATHPNPNIRPGIYEYERSVTGRVPTVEILNRKNKTFKGMKAKRIAGFKL
ncbi:MAG: hypothetical protein PHS46_08190 [Candidatus Omnitrophica bacterium]|nr:hypothetical protein [Candidatus Omnitrophota bacterium]